VSVERVADKTPANELCQSTTSLMCETATLTPIIVTFSLFDGSIGIISSTKFCTDRFRDFGLLGADTAISSTLNATNALNTVTERYRVYM
jgi:hypothetical protein